jgi:hypothetical protein
LALALHRPLSALEIWELELQTPNVPEKWLIVESCEPNDPSPGKDLRRMLTLPFFARDPE